MKFSIGDKIKLRKTGEEGEVVDIVQDQYIRVRVDGQVIPVEEQDLDFPYLDWFLKARKEEKKVKKQYVDTLKIEKKEERKSKYEFSEGFYLIFQPIFREVDMEEIIHRFRLYVYNETDMGMDFMVNIATPKEHLFSYEGELLPGREQLLYSIEFDAATDNPSFAFEFTPQNGMQKPMTFEKKVKLGRKFLIEKVQYLQQENLPLFEWRIFDRLKPKEEKIDIPKLIGQNRSKMTVLGTKRTQKKAKQEIDLHIEKIYKGWEDLSNAEIIQIQLDNFDYYLDLALADTGINPLRVVHGIGDGVLKKEINMRCAQTFGVLRYVYEGYNPGVTLIYFKN